MKEKQAERVYTAPQMKVLEIKARKVLCQSPLTIMELIEREDGEWS